MCSTAPQTLASAGPPSTGALSTNQSSVTTEHVLTAGPTAIDQHPSRTKLPLASRMKTCVHQLHLSDATSQIGLHVRLLASPLTVACGVNRARMEFKLWNRLTSSTLVSQVRRPTHAQMALVSKTLPCADLANSSAHPWEDASVPCKIATPTSRTRC